MSKANSKIAIIVLNWNGWQDTCECLSSIMQSEFQDFQIIVVDNGSTDESIAKIKSWAQGTIDAQGGPFMQNTESTMVSFQEIDAYDIQIRQRDADNSSNEKMILIKNKENLGFAAGTNIGIRYAQTAGFEYVFLLNNDTTIDSNCLLNLIEFEQNSSKYKVISPIIYYYNEPDRVWYFGGKLTFTGRRKPYLSDQKIDRESVIKDREISFISGCALFARSEIFRTFGLLTERFFFGEEDYDFSLRMRENNVKMCGLSSARVYHKVGRSNSKVFSEDRLPYKLIGYMNRFVDKKIHTKSNFVWQIWRFINLLYITPKLILLEKYKVRKIIKFVSILVRYSNINTTVDREFFFKAKQLLK